MIAFISVFIPPLIMAYLRMKKNESIYRKIVDYIFCLLSLNFFMLLIVCYGFDSRENLFFKLNQYNDFAVKYIMLSSALAVIEPYLEKFAREKLVIELNHKPIKCAKAVHWKLIIGIYAAALFMMNFIRIFDNNFWGDEAYTIQLIKRPISEVISGTAADVHPPLYYLFVKLVYVLFGNRGWVYHLVSLIPCAVIILLSLTIFWKKFGKEFSVILITLACLSGNAVYYNMEVRMYSWGSLFVLLSFYELHCILQREDKHSYLLFMAFSLAAAYVHYYCLVTVAFYYIVILYLASFRKRLNLKKVIFVCVCTVLGYLPWAIILVKSIKRVNDYFWITSIPSMKNCINYLFSNCFSPIAWGGYYGRRADFCPV